MNECFGWVSLTGSRDAFSSSSAAVVCLLSDNPRWLHMRYDYFHTAGPNISTPTQGPSCMAVLSPEIHRGDVRSMKGYHPKDTPNCGRFPAMMFWLVIERTTTTPFTEHAVSWVAELGWVSVLSEQTAKTFIYQSPYVECLTLKAIVTHSLKQGKMQEHWDGGHHESKR